MNKLLALIEVLENKQEDGTITTTEQDVFFKLIEKFEKQFYKLEPKN
jgi:hypothetical protein